MGFRNWMGERVTKASERMREGIAVRRDGLADRALSAIIPDFMRTAESLEDEKRAYIGKIGALTQAKNVEMGGQTRKISELSLKEARSLLKRIEGAQHKGEQVSDIVSGKTREGEEHLRKIKKLKGLYFENTLKQLKKIETNEGETEINQVTPGQLDEVMDKIEKYRRMGYSYRDIFNPKGKTKEQIKAEKEQRESGVNWWLRKGKPIYKKPIAWLAGLTVGVGVLATLLTGGQDVQKGKKQMPAGKTPSIQPQDFNRGVHLETLAKAMTRHLGETVTPEQVNASLKKHKKELHVYYTGGKITGADTTTSIKSVLKGWNATAKQTNRIFGTYNANAPK